MITIVSPIYLGQQHRVEYYQKFINSCKNQNNFNKIQFIFFYENTIVDYNLIYELKSYNNIDLHINSYDFKTFLNQYNCLNYCFEHLKLDHVIYLEDDVETSNDLYDITNFYINSEHYHDNNIFCYLNKDNLIDDVLTKSDLIQVKPFMRGNMGYFTPWGFLATKYMWNNALKYWNKKRSFDFEIVEIFKNTHQIISPQESRVNHIGEIGASYNKALFESHNFNTYKVKQYQNPIIYTYV
jgi:hypothetical protein